MQFWTLGKITFVTSSKKIKNYLGCSNVPL